MSEVRPFGVIYQVTNKINGKIYVGQTRHTISKRWAGHKTKALSKTESKYPLHWAIRKYGAESFSIHILAECADKCSLNMEESRWILALGSLVTQGGYNCTSGGTEKGSLSQETRDKLSRRARERFASKSPEEKDQICLHLKRLTEQRWSAEWAPEGILRGQILGCTITEYQTKKGLLGPEFPRVKDFPKVYGKTFQEIRDGYKKGYHISELLLSAEIQGLSTNEYRRLKLDGYLDHTYPDVKSFPKVYGKKYREVRDGARREVLV